MLSHGWSPWPPLWLWLLSVDCTPTGGLSIRDGRAERRPAWTRLWHRTPVDMGPGAWPWAGPCQGRELVRAVLASLPEAHRGTHRVAPPLAGALTASTHAPPTEPCQAPISVGSPGLSSTVVSSVLVLLPIETLPACLSLAPLAWIPRVCAPATNVHRCCLGSHACGLFGLQR